MMAGMVAGIMGWLSIVWAGGLFVLAVILIMHVIREIHRAWVRRCIRKAERFPARNVMLTPEMFRRNEGR